MKMQAINVVAEAVYATQGISDGVEKNPKGASKNPIIRIIPQNGIGGDSVKNAMKL